jgi:hypothetical protein
MQHIIALSLVLAAPYYFLAKMAEGKDRNRAFWIPFAEERITALGFSP